MRIKLPEGVYTQLNTNTDAYLIQNLGNCDVGIVISDTAPSNTAQHDYIIEPREGLGNKYIKGICWGKPIGPTKGLAGVVEE